MASGQGQLFYILPLTSSLYLGIFHLPSQANGSDIYLPEAFSPTPMQIILFVKVIK